MITFQVDDMTCGHCARRIIEAVTAVDLGAKVEVDVEGRLVRIRPSERSESELGVAIRDAGYTAKPVPPTASTTAASTTQRACCCRG